MQTTIRAALAALAFLALAAPHANAAPRHRSAAPVTEFCGDRYCPVAAQRPSGERTAAFAGAPAWTTGPARAVARVAAAGAEVAAKILPNPADCPRVAFCGCGVSDRVFGRPVRSLFRAIAWGRFPAAPPAAGRVAYNSRHVFYIERVLGVDRVLAYDPNSGGHLTRLHVRSLRGFRVVDPHHGGGQERVAGLAGARSGAIARNAHD